MELTRRALLKGASLILFPVLPVHAAQAEPEPKAVRLIEAARGQIGVTILYDPAYIAIAYPGGDVPRDRGVCTDVIVRAYRDGLGIDLQAEIHRDMKAAFDAYPRTWGLKRTDANIDHRRVGNIATFLARKGGRASDGSQPADIRPGDVIAFALPDGRPHIGLAGDRMTDDGVTPKVIHNIGAGAQEEAVIGAFRITGHFRWFG